MTADSGSPRVELRVRDPTPAGVYARQNDVYEQLRRLREDGCISEVSVEVWGKQVPVGDDAGPTAAGTAARGTYEEFEEWAERNGHALEPAFSTHTLGSLVTDDQERTEVIRFPVMCLAVYDGDDLLAVAPSSTDDGVRTIDDCLSALRSRQWVPTPIEHTE